MKRGTRSLALIPGARNIANQLAGVAGSAGILATATEVAAIGQLLLDGGTHNGTRILSAATAAAMLTNRARDPAPQQC